MLIVLYLFEQQGVLKCSLYLQQEGATGLTKVLHVHCDAHTSQYVNDVHAVMYTFTIIQL